MTRLPIFPTVLHRQVADVVHNYFSKIPQVDTLLVVNSCARGKAVPESDLDFAILARARTSRQEIAEIEAEWLDYANAHPLVAEYKQSGPYAHLHLDVIDGIYTPQEMETGGGIDYFEIEIGNQIAYSATLGDPGPHFLELQKRWLPYYGEGLRKDRWKMARNACLYDLHHIPFFVKRQLYFQAFDLLYKAFQTYQQTLFITHRKYPIAYNKWIKEQVIDLLSKPDLYPNLAPIISVTNLESKELNEKAKMLQTLLDDLSFQ